jgi:hypothetical protein
MYQLKDEILEDTSITLSSLDPFDCDNFDNICDKTMVGNVMIRNTEGSTENFNTAQCFYGKNIAPLYSITE